MDSEEKARIMYEHLLTDVTYTFLGDTSGSLTMPSLAIYGDLIRGFTEEDFIGINEQGIFLNLIFSPASNSILKVNVPARAKVITIDYNQLSKYPRKESIAIILHEYGHAFNPQLKGEAGEFAADDFAINHNYGEALKQSLERNIRENPNEFDKEITHTRIGRI